MTDSRFMPWLEYAINDLASAKYLQSMRPVPLEVICYLCEPSAEKLLKGYLLANGVEAPKIHDLRELCRRCMAIDELFRELAEACIILTPYAVQVRYPEQLEVEAADMEQAIIMADQVMNFLKPILNRFEMEDKEKI